MKNSRSTFMRLVMMAAAAVLPPRQRKPKTYPDKRSTSSCRSRPGAPPM